VSRGSALVEVIVIGVVIVAAITHAVVTAGRIHAAGELATEAAQVAAAWAVRHGDAEDAEATARAVAPRAESVRVVRTGDEIRVDVRLAVSLLGSLGPRHLVTGRAAARLSPYRSNRG
jgi:hypothetical protein